MITADGKFLFIIIFIIILICGISIYFVLQYPNGQTQISLNKNTSITVVANNTVGLTDEGGHVSGILEGPIVVNISQKP